MKFNTLAKLTHNKYGINNNEAGQEMGANKIMVIKINIHNRIISMKANKGACKPKNNIDHKKFRNSCTPKIIRAHFKSLFPEVQTRYKDIPIIKYKMVQTGPNTQLGGLKLGLVKVTYQEETDEAVNNDPKIPANWQTTIERMSLRKSIFIREE